MAFIDTIVNSTNTVKLGYSDNTYKIVHKQGTTLNTTTIVDSIYWNDITTEPFELDFNVITSPVFANKAAIRVGTTNSTSFAGFYWDEIR